MFRVLKIRNFLPLLVILLLIYAVCSESTYTVTGISMEPTFTDGQKVTLSFTKTYLRDDVIVFTTDGTRCIKRIVGMPGDTILLKDNSLYINDELYLEDASTENNTYFVYSEYTLDEDEYFVLGDNTKSSVDSRIYGPIKSMDIKGVVLYATSKISS